jgi:Kef-type K+ transport system membrane component KefB
MPIELPVVGLLLILFVVPKVLQRFRIPTAIAELGLGAIAGMGLHLFHGDATVALLSSFGIIALFLFAGLEVDAAALWHGREIVLQHLLVRVLLLAVATFALEWTLGLSLRPAILLALALLTPSTGFILSSLPSLGFTEAETFWIKVKAISTEIVALLVLFAVTQSHSAGRFSSALVTLVALIAVLPAVFRFFAARIAPYAPRSEFAFLLVMGVLCGYATMALGVYYLVGAFVVGWAAQRLRALLPLRASDELLRAIELFAAFFVPFYFFSAGLHLTSGEFTARSALYGGIFLALGIPVRLFAVTLQRRVSLGEKGGHALRIALCLSPTLVFSLVLAEILRDRYNIAPEIFGGLVIYAIGTTLVPIFTLRIPPPPDLPPLPIQATWDEPSSRELS